MNNNFFKNLSNDKYLVGNIDKTNKKYEVKTDIKRCIDKSIFKPIVSSLI